MTWLDVSRPLDPSRLKVWPGDPPLKSWLVSRIDATGCNVTAASLSLHAGTHMDAPRHYIAEGRAAEEIPLDACMGPARLLVHAAARHLAAPDLEGHDLGESGRILIATGYAEREGDPPFPGDYRALLPEAARLLVEKGIRLVGIDSPSIGPPGEEGEETHRILLSSEVVVLEGLVLSGLRPGDYELAALPVAVWGSDGAPVRAAVRPIGG